MEDALDEKPKEEVETGPGRSALLFSSSPPHLLTALLLAVCFYSTL